MGAGGDLEDGSEGVLCVLEVVGKDEVEDRLWKNERRTRSQSLSSTRRRADLLDLRRAPVIEKDEGERVVSVESPRKREKKVA